MLPTSLVGGAQNANASRHYLCVIQNSSNMAEPVAGPSLIGLEQVSSDDIPDLDKDPDSPIEKEVVKQERIPRPSTSFAPERDCFVEEEEQVEGFVEIPEDQMEYTTKPASFEKAPCSSMSVCPFCGKRFLSYRVLIAHAKLNHVTESQTRANFHILNSLMKECKMCDYMTPHYSHLKKHMIFKHKNYEPFQCSFCDFKTSMQVTLRKHVRLYHSNKKLYQCLKCDFKALTNFSKQIHINTVHIDGRILQCSECDFSAKRESTLMKHIKLNHPNVLPHECAFCLYKTDSAKKLKVHIHENHSDEKPFQCPICTYKAEQFSNFKKHLALKHSQVYDIMSSWSPYI